MLQTSKTPRLPKVTDRKPPKAQIEKLRAIAARFPGQMPRAEYPRPQLRRPDWRCLNGQKETSSAPKKP